MDRTLPEVLAAVAAELALLADLASALQTQISAPACCEAQIEALQDLDRLTQSLACLAPFVASVGAGAPCERGVRLNEALGRIWMSELADRLVGGPATTGPRVSGCELFE